MSLPATSTVNPSAVSGQSDGCHSLASSLPSKISQRQPPVIHNNINTNSQQPAAANHHGTLKTGLIATDNPHATRTVFPVAHILFVSRFYVFRCSRSRCLVFDCLVLSCCSFRTSTSTWSTLNCRLPLTGAGTPDQLRLPINLQQPAAE